MTIRFIALGFLGLTLAFIVLMASVSFFVREPLPIIGANQTLLLHTVEISPQIRSSVAIDGAYRVELTIEHAPEQSPEIVLRPVNGHPITLKCRIDTAIEREYVEHGGVLHYVLRDLAGAA